MSALLVNSEIREGRRIGYFCESVDKAPGGRAILELQMRVNSSFEYAKTLFASSYRLIWGLSMEIENMVCI
jgi:hypothetical protein